MTALFEDVIFGPIESRRLGCSLGVNLLPERAKICNFDCIYCECGSNDERRGTAAARRFADRERVHNALEATLCEMAEAGRLPDVITFAGNGEPTLHPEFRAIIDDTIELRNRLCPSAKVSVLSNATTLDRSDVVEALRRVENNILKLDSAIETTAAAINRPAAGYSAERVISQMAQFEGECVVQTMFLRGEIGGVAIDNTTPEELEAWYSALRRIGAQRVMIYSIARDTPCSGISAVSKEEMMSIAEEVRKMGFECSVS